MIKRHKRNFRISGVAALAIISIGLFLLFLAYAEIELQWIDVMF